MLTLAKSWNNELGNLFSSLAKIFSTLESAFISDWWHAILCKFAIKNIYGYYSPHPISHQISALSKTLYKCMQFFIQEVFNNFFFAWELTTMLQMHWNYHAIWARICSPSKLTKKSFFGKKKQIWTNIFFVPFLVKKFVQNICLSKKGGNGGVVERCC